MLRSRPRPLALLVLAAGVSLSAAAVAAGTSRKSPHVEIVGEGTVVDAPRETKHKNGRRFLEFEIVLSSAHVADEQPAGADRNLKIDTTGRVKVVHDLSCGGAALPLAQGDRVAIAGEYVHVPKGGDLIHFTHPADGSCGPGGAHPAGYLRKLAAPAAAAGPRGAIPDQPYVGTPRPVEKPYRAIVAAKEAGATNDELLARVGREKVVYSLSTPEIQQLRAAGVSEKVVEAMLRSGRTPAAPAGPTPR